MQSIISIILTWMNIWLDLSFSSVRCTFLILFIDCVTTIELHFLVRINALRLSWIGTAANRRTRIKWKRLEHWSLVIASFIPLLTLKCSTSNRAVYLLRRFFIVAGESEVTSSQCNVHSINRHFVACWAVWCWIEIESSENVNLDFCAV